MTASRRFLNWSNVVFIPHGGTPTAITGVTSVVVDSGGSLLKFAGDGDRYATTVVNDFNDPTVTIQAADLATIRSFPVGTTGTFSATHNDARNGDSTGSITYTLTNAVVSSNPIQGAYRQFGKGTLTLTAFSIDGLTNPLSSSVAI